MTTKGLAAKRRRIQINSAKVSPRMLGVIHVLDGKKRAVS